MNGQNKIDILTKVVVCPTCLLYDCMCLEDKIEMLKDDIKAHHLALQGKANKDFFLSAEELKKKEDEIKAAEELAEPETNKWKNNDPDGEEECEFCGKKVNSSNNYRDEWNNKYWDICYDCGIANNVGGEE